MIKIAVVDDELRDRKIILSYFEQIKLKLHEELKIDLYDSGEKLLETMNADYDLICLDIDLQGIDGVETARKIREQDSEVIILFVTNMAKLAIKGYEVHALDFILKPIQYYSFAMKIQNALSIINNKKCKRIVLPTPTGIIKISSNELYYAEVKGHYLFYHLEDGVYKQKASMKDLEIKLEGLSFKRCNNCYLINLKYVDCVDKDEIKIKGEWLKISRPRRKGFLLALSNYMGGISI